MVFLARSVSCSELGLIVFSGLYRVFSLVYIVFSARSISCLLRSLSSLYRVLSKISIVFSASSVSCSKPGMYRVLS